MLSFKEGATKLLLYLPKDFYVCQIKCVLILNQCDSFLHTGLCHKRILHQICNLKTVLEY